MSETIQQWKLGDQVPVPDMPTRMIVDFQGGYCNLKCPKCFVHGSDDSEAIKKLRGQMSLENAKKILDEVMATKPLLQPNLWTEPMMAKQFKEHIAAVKNAGMPVAINTNGLLLTDEMAQFFVDIKLDSVFISIDAMDKETLLQTRGTDKLDKIEEAVHRMIRVRGENPLPRIGVSFTVEKANRKDREAFVEKWIGVVDVIRIGECYEVDGSVLTHDESLHRVPCGHLYHTMPIHYNGNVSICCLDGFQSQIMGNVFEDGGVKAVWHGEKFQQMRHYHETGQYDKVPFCKNCNVWASHTFTDEVKDNLLIRRAPLMTYYNRIDKSANWNLKHNSATKKWGT